MTKREALNYSNLEGRLHRLGLDTGDINALLRIEKTLHRWAERECNGEVEVDEETGKAFAMRFESSQRAYQAANRERGALKRLAAIMARYPKLAAYQQGDPRGCALYVYRKADLCVSVPADTIESCYSSVGVAVCL